MNEENLITYLTKAYNTAQESKDTALSLNIGYRAKNKTFSIEIDGHQYFMTKYKLADKIGDKLAGEIMLWVI